MDSMLFIFDVWRGQPRAKPKPSPEASEGYKEQCQSGGEGAKKMLVQNDQCNPPPLFCKRGFDNKGGVFGF